MTEGFSERITIRDAAPGDAGLLLRLITELAEYEQLSELVEADEDAIRERVFGEGSTVSVVIAEVDAEPAGFLLYFRNFSTFMGRYGLYVEDIFVRPQHRGRGVGKALMRYCARIAAEHGYGRIEWSVLDWNPARSFYEKLGAEHLAHKVLYRLAGPDIDALADS